MDHDATDAVLLRRFAHERDEGAFAELVGRYVGLVFHAATRQLGAEAEAASDVSQRVFVLLARKAAGLGEASSLAGWLHVTTRNVTREHLRAERRRREREQEAFLMSEHLKTSAHDAEWARLRPVIDEAVGELGERDREAVLLRYFAGLKHAEIAARLALPENTARMRVERAVARLREALVRRGVTSTEAALGLVLANQSLAGTTVPAGLAQALTSAAVGSAAASAGPGAFFAIMSTTKMAVSGAALLALVAVGVAWRETRLTRAAEAELAAARERTRVAVERVAAREAEVRAKEGELGRLLREAEADRRVAATPATGAVAAKPATAREPGNWKPQEQGDAFMARHPVVREAFVAWLEAKANHRFGALFAQLRLPPDKEAELRALLREQMQFAPSVGTDEKPMTLRMSGASHTELERKIEALLGPGDYRKYQEYLRDAPARDFTTRIASALSFSEAPLNAGQAERLRRIIAESAPNEDVRKVDWDAVVNAASPLLQPTQARTLAQFRDKQVLDAAFNAAVRDAQKRPVGGAPKP